MLDISALVKEWFGNHKKIQIQETVIKLEEAQKTKKKAIPRGCSEKASQFKN